MLKIRLTRRGRKHLAFYHIVVADARAPRDGKFVADLGYYDPNQDPPLISIKKEEYENWVKKGAQPTHAVEKLWERFNNPKKRRKKRKKVAKQKKQKAEEAKKQKADVNKDTKEKSSASKNEK